jgi:membrane-associated protein
MTELLTMMATPAWAYLALFGFLAIDAMIPVVPIQAIMITSGALTVYGNLNLALVIAVGALGMFTGDAIAYTLGRQTCADRGSGGMAAGFYAGRRKYPIKLFVLYDGAAAIAWGMYGGLVGHVGGTAITQSAWRLFAIAATAALVFGTAGWILALFGGRKGANAGEKADEKADETPDDRPARIRY